MDKIKLIIALIAIVALCAFPILVLCAGFILSDNIYVIMTSFIISCMFSAYMIYNVWNIIKKTKK